MKVCHLTQSLNTIGLGTRDHRSLVSMRLGRGSKGANVSVRDRAPSPLPYTFKVSVPPVGCAAFLFLRADADTPLRRIVSVV